jgi:hypothetical protein
VQNLLTCLPDTISALVNLRKLTASHNHLEGPMGPGLFMCLHLREIDLSHNAITSLHEDIKVRGDGWRERVGMEGAFIISEEDGYTSEPHGYDQRQRGYGAFPSHLTLLCAH